MCLQWCHVHRWVIDNDLPCTGCDRYDLACLPAFWSCATCCHRVERGDAPPICALTRETLPLAGRCCHWQAPLTREATLHLADDAIAPWLHGSAIDVFTESPSAPPITVADGRVVVALDDLSVPLVYGVPADAWDAALGWDTAATCAWDAPPGDARPQAITAALSALELDGPALAAALAELARVMESAGAATLPDGWGDIVIQLIALGRELHGADPDVLVLLNHLEADTCTSH